MKVWILILILSQGLNTYAQKDQNNIQLQDSINLSALKSSYRRGEIISFTVLNLSSRDIYISSSLVQYFSKERDWIERVPDLSNYNCDLREKFGVTYILLKSSNSLLIDWDPKKANQSTCFAWNKNRGQYKIILKLSQYNDNQPIIKASTPFFIK